LGPTRCNTLHLPLTLTLYKPAAKNIYNTQAAKAKARKAAKGGGGGEEDEEEEEEEDKPVVGSCTSVLFYYLVQRLSAARCSRKHNELVLFKLNPVDP
jgi:hypothetical protein